MKFLFRTLFVALTSLFSIACRSETLQLDEVLKMVDESFPMNEATRADSEAARGELRSAEGAFDIQWKTRAAYAPLGFYQNERLDSVLEQPTSVWGATLFGGYRLGVGKFAIYDGKLETNPGGEVRLGFNVPVLRDGAIDRRRANIRRAKVGVTAADFQVEQQRLESIKNATHRYWDWVAAGKRLSIYRTLLKIAEERDLGLAERVRHGDLPDFERSDNERAILQRRSQLVAAERSFQQAAIELSLYFRDKDKQPLLVPEERLPPTIPVPGAAEVPQKTVADALNARPDLAKFNALKSQNEIERTLAINQRGPKLDLQLQAVQSLQAGAPSRNGAQLEAGVLLEIPLQANVAAGREDASVATASKLELQERLLRDRIGAEVRDAKSALEASLTRFQVTRREVELAKKLEQGERERFNHGDSTLLFVNLREQSTVDAAIRELDALVDYRKSLATLRAALADI